MTRLVPALFAGVFAAFLLVFALGAMQPLPRSEVVPPAAAAHRTTLETKLIDATPRATAAIATASDSEVRRRLRSTKTATADRSPVLRSKDRPARSQAPTRIPSGAALITPAEVAATTARFAPFVGAVRLRPEVVVDPAVEADDVVVARPTAVVPSPPPSAGPEPSPRTEVPSGSGPASAASGSGGRSRGAAGRLTPAPMYPRAARSAGEEGVVIVRLRIGADGRVVAASVIGGDASRRLQDAVVVSVRSWTFEPALRDGRPVESDVVRRFVFNLKDAP